MAKNPRNPMRTFVKLMVEGKVRSALRLITQNSNNGVLQLNPVVKDALLNKHPPKQPAVPNTILTLDRPTQDPNPALFDAIDGTYMIHEPTLRTDGAAGPSSLDASAWKRLCCSFRNTSVDLCDALTLLARRICSSYVDPVALRPFTACRLIALNKCPGVRPIGIGEIVRRIIGRAIISIIRDEIQAVAGTVQLCAGQEARGEAAVHAIKPVFESPDADAVILVDATNAFNSLNRENALRNIQHLCPPIVKILINTYREDAQLYIDGQTLLSQEGTTQVDPLAMAMFGIGLVLVW